MYKLTDTFVLKNDFCCFRSSAYTTLNKMVTVSKIIFAVLLIISLFDIESQNFVTMARKVVIVPNVCDM